MGFCPLSPHCHHRHSSHTLEGYRKSMGASQDTFELQHGVGKWLVLVS